MKVTTISKRKFRELQPLILGQEICNSESEVFYISVPTYRNMTGLKSIVKYL